MSTGLPTTNFAISDNIFASVLSGVSKRFGPDEIQLMFPNIVLLQVLFLL